MNPGKIKISRPTRSDGKDFMTIRVGDKQAGVEFLEIQMTLEDFTRALSGEYGIPCEIATQNLNKVGKIRETQAVRFMISEGGGCMNQKEVAINLLPENTPEGWVADNYFGSKDSFSYHRDEHGNDMVWASTTIRRWVDRNA